MDQRSVIPLLDRAHNFRDVDVCPSRYRREELCDRRRVGIQQRLIALHPQQVLTEIELRVEVNEEHTEIALQRGVPAEVCREGGLTNTALHVHQGCYDGAPSRSG